MIKVCVECGEEFDLHSSEKNRAGGKINNCPDCSVETAIRYAGFQAADGKQSQATILKFNSEQDKKAYISFWQNNSGYHKSKSCQLGAHLSTTPGIQFETIQGFKPTNHKGKA
jgi:DNA-directed RNA polymerase subunit RPC12/RpoP